MKHNRVTWVAISVLLAVAAVAYYMTNTGSPAPALAGAKGDVKAADPAKGAGAGAATPVEVIVVQPVTVQEDLQAVGSMRSNESVVLRPEVSGRIATIGFRDGQVVRKGQLLIGLDATLNEAEVAQYQAEHDLALSNLRRSEDLARQKFISSSAQETAASNAQVAEARLKLAQARLSKMRIVAPFDGVVGIRGVSLGDYVKDGADLVNVEDVRNLKVDFRLPERSLPQVRVGQSVEVVADALPDESWQGEIEAINPRIDANGRSLELRARLDNSKGRLRPGMFARVRVIVGERSNALLVPEEAIVPQGGQFFVYKVVEGAARRVPVKLGVRRDARVEILDGIAAGDQVVTAGMRLSRDGQPVRVLPPEGGLPKGAPSKGDSSKGSPKDAGGAGKA
ncbi:MAG: efflux RND transporter periplasmic adaptor subunit [Burkholderiaceae bacterium]|jgi:membrane fusion protein (multidrug efflux system)|nr:efflux RND transporter periplasmic adaptor subunit [Burkholderiaceae bacterium]